MAGAAGQRVPTRREEQGAASRQRILECAAALMAERGFAGTSISAVRRRSGLPASSIYWHFGSKQGLLRGVMEDGAQRWWATLPRWDELPGPDEARVGQMLEATARSLETQPEFLRLMFLIALERREIDPESLETIRHVRELGARGMRAVVRSILAPAGDAVAPGTADEFAAFALACVDGCFIQHHIDSERTDLSRLFALLGRALRALAAGSEL